MHTLERQTHLPKTLVLKDELCTFKRSFHQQRKLLRKQTIHKALLSPQ